MGRKYQPLSKTVKETVDLVFELTTSNPDGYEMKAKELGNTGKLVVRILLQRGILERVRMKNKVHAFLYKWAVASAPTKVLYGSITQELTDMIRKKNEKYNAKKKDAEWKDIVKEIPCGEPAQEPVNTIVLTPAPTVSIFDPFSDQELWYELKRHGYFIEGERLCIVNKSYLD